MNEILKQLCEHFRTGVLNPDRLLAPKFSQDEINLAKQWFSDNGYVVATPHRSSRGDRLDGSPDQVFVKELTEAGRDFVKQTCSEIADS